jgi:hypothetical protein
MVDPSFSGRPGMTPASLRIVRYAMLMVVLLFGAFAYYQSTHTVPLPVPGEDGADVPTLRWVGFALGAGVIVGIAVMRQLRERADVSARPTFGLIGSAMGESVAVFGAVIMLLGGDIAVYALGVLLFLATWTLLPADSESA